MESETPVIPQTPSAPANLATTTIRGTLWTYASYYGGKVMVFLSTIILARLLLKEDFGVAGYALTVIALLDVHADLGVGTALIYYRDDPNASDTAFWLSMGIGLGLFGLVWIAAPSAGAYFNDDRAIPLTRALALTLPISALSNVQNMLLRKNLQFGRKMIPDMLRATSKGVFSILFALLGMGAWALVWGQVAGTAISTFAYWWVLPWRPSFNFVRAIARRLLSYGLGIFSVNTLNIFVANADYLFVGRYLGAEALGAYTLAFRIPELVILQFCNIISRVVFPIYAKIREEPGALGRGFLITERYTALVTVPLGLGLALVADPFVRAFLTQKWVDAIPVMRAISIYALFLSFGYNAGDVYKAQGRPMLLTWLTIVQGFILVPALYWAATALGSIEAVGWTHAVVAFIVSVIDLTVALWMIKTPLSAMLDALRPAFVSGAVMSAGVWGALLGLSHLDPWAQLLIALPLGGAMYLGSLWLLERALVAEAADTLRAAFKRR